MTPIPLDQIRLRWRDHKSALWWLGLLYRRPAEFHEELWWFPRLTKIKMGCFLYVHFLPYLFILCIIGRILVFGILGIEAATEHPTLNYHISLIAFAILLGIFIGLVIGTILGRRGGVAVVIIGGIAGAIAFGIGIGISIGIASANVRGFAVVVAVTAAGSIVTNIASSIFGGFPGGSASRVTFVIATAVIFGSISGRFTSIAVAIAIGIATDITLIFSILRLYYLPLHWLLVWPSPRLRWAHYHPALWDDLCLVPFTGLHRLLVAQAEAKRWRGKYAIERIIRHYPAQRREALKAKVILLARRAARVTDLTQLDSLLARLPEGEKGFLAQTRQIRAEVSELGRLQTRLNTANRPAFQEMYAENLYQAIDSFRHRIQGFHEPLATEFGAAALQWLKLAEAQRAAATAKLTTKPTEQFFRAGDPVNREQEAFAERTAVLEQLEQQVMLGTGCPGIVLYGRRRMGKSTLLRNLTGFLPLEVLTVNVSMQNPQLVASLASFAHTLAEQVQTQAPGLKLNEALPDDLPRLFRFLTAANEKLAAEQYRLLLAVDEYEALDAKIGAGVFPHDLLDTLRESIQTHRRLTWIFAGSHEITELPHAAWTSALVSARTIEVPVFTLAETRLLLTEPLKHSSLWKDNEAKRPRFGAAFWGTEEGSGIDFIQEQAGGWPHLVQLIAETLVDLINEEQAAAVTPALMQRALDKAIVRGHNVLYELLRRESTLPGEWEYLERFKRVDMQPLPDDEAVARSLRRRELMAIANGEWRLRVPLMERWLRVRG